MNTERDPRPAVRPAWPDGDDAPCLMAFVDEQASLEPDRKLSNPAFRVWVHLHRHADGRTGMSVSAGIEQLARAIGASSGHVRRAIKELLDHGYLVRTVRGRSGWTSRYVVRGVAGDAGVRTAGHPATENPAARSR